MINKIIFVWVYELENKSFFRYSSLLLGKLRYNVIFFFKKCGERIYLVPILFLKTIDLIKVVSKILKFDF